MSVSPDNVLYFAYGSNMSSRRLGQRIHAARSLGAATAGGFRVVFHKVGSVDASGKCGLLRAAPEDIAHGVLFELPATEVARLDAFEGLGKGYERIELTVLPANERPVTALSYLATRLDESLQPFDWYMQHVLTGALEHALPARYRRNLEAIATISDPDQARHQREIALYADP